MARIHRRKTVIRPAIRPPRPHLGCYMATKINYAAILFPPRQAPVPTTWLPRSMQLRRHGCGIRAVGGSGTDGVTGAGAAPAPACACSYGAGKRPAASSSGESRIHPAMIKLQARVGNMFRPTFSAYRWGPARPALDPVWAPPLGTGGPASEAWVRGTAGLWSRGGGRHGARVPRVLSRAAVATGSIGGLACAGSCREPRPPRRPAVT